LRISQAMQEYLKNSKLNKKDEVFLFGSRVDDSAKGGDIDTFILSNEKYSMENIRSIKMGFMQKFGWQKLDLLNWTFDEKNTFKDFIIDDAIKL
jgi:predicted nucleotidyltransferase